MLAEVVDAVVGVDTLARSCRDPHAEWVEVRCSHTGLSIDPDVYAALAPRLARWATDQGPRSVTRPESAAS